MRSRPWKTPRPHADIFVTATGNKDVLTVDHMRAMKNNAIVCNIGHFDSEIQIAGLKQLQVGRDQAAGPPRGIPGRQEDHRAVRRPPGEPGQRHRPPELRDVSVSFTNQTLAQIELWTNGKAYKNQVYTLPKHLDEKVAMLHLDKLGVKLTKLSKEQADYIGVPEAARSSRITIATDPWLASCACPQQDARMA